METHNNISLEDCCKYYSVETSFIQKLNEYGLIELTEINKKYTIQYEQLPLLEKYSHMHYDMDINMEGIEAISHLLARINNLQQEIISLRNSIID